MSTKKYFEIKPKLEKLKSLNPESTSPKQFEGLLRNIIVDGNTILAVTVENDILFRGRQNLKGQLFNHVDELKYPKPEFVLRKGRLNDIGESILYASTSLTGCLVELRPSIQFVLTVINIAKKPTANSYFIPIGIEKFEKHNFSFCRSEKLIFEYLKQELSKVVDQENHYNSSIAIANYFFGLSQKMIVNNKISTIHSSIGLVFPSVQSKLTTNITTFNIAMKPRLYEDCYYISEVTVYGLTLEPDDQNPKSVCMTPLNVGAISPDGKINWKFDYAEMVYRSSNGYGCGDFENEHIKSILL
ncbi:MAG: hypothetical protein V4629_00010 [Pseudomonadota bacterium]